MIKTELDSMPTELDEITRKIMQLEIEESCTEERGDLSKERLQNCRKNLQKKGQIAIQKAQWENEKHSLSMFRRSVRRSSR